MKTIIICPDDFKKKRLSDLYKSQKINEDFYITLEQLKERLFFKITTEAKLFSRDYLNVKYSVACTLLNNLYYVENEYDHENLNKLRELKKELVKKDLLIFDDLFKFYLKRHKVIVMGYLLSKTDMLLIDEVKKYTSVEIEEVNYSYKKLTAVKYHTIEDEIDNTFKNIVNLVNNNVSLNDIKITNVDSSYTHLLRRYSEFYNVKINFKKNDSLLSSPIINYFLNLYKENKDLGDIVDKLKEKYNNNDIIRKIVNVINNQTNVSNDLTDVFLYEFEKLKFDEVRFDNAIEIVDFYNYEFNDNNHVFIMNFNNATLPREFKDDQYLTDNITFNINLDTTLDKITLELESIKIKLFNIKNIVVSFKEKTKSKEVMPSRLIKTLEMDVVNNNDINEYSNLNAKLKAGMYLEDFIKYDDLNEELFKYYYLIKDNFNSYKNDYSKVDVNLVKERLSNKIKLSYTSLSTYYKCSFAYYLERVLKIRIDNGNFYSLVGTVFHEILEHMDDPNFNYQEEIDTNRGNFKTNQELFYYDKLSNQFVESLSILKAQKECTSLRTEYPEEKVEFVHNNIFEGEFVGLVDKIIHRKINSKDYVAVIDYKTGNVSASLENVEDGFNLQLPIYAYLLKKTDRFKDPIVLGMFLQQILNPIPKYDPKSSYEDKIKDDLKLKGFVVGEEDLEILDKTFEKSEMISGLRSNSAKTGLYHHSKVLDEVQFDELADIVENLIKDTFTNIEKMNFDINPKVINAENKSCMYCKYSSICYLKHSDKVTLKKTNFLKKEESSNVDETTTTSN